MNKPNKVCLIGFLLLWSFYRAKGQEDIPLVKRHQVFLQMDNDAFAFTHYDRYYTHGMQLGYAFQMTSQSRLKASFSHQIYTPEYYTAKSSKFYDRPFAGVFYGKVGYQWIKKAGWLEGNILLGRVGPGAKAKEVQTWYHTLLGFPQPQGWNSQIKSGRLANIDVSGAYGMDRGGHFDFWLASNFSWFQKMFCYIPFFEIGQAFSFSTVPFQGPEPEA